MFCLSQTRAYGIGKWPKGVGSYAFTQIIRGLADNAHEYYTMAFWLAALSGCMFVLVGLDSSSRYGRLKVCSVKVS